ncbi:heterokaryon incompatibility protein-domain-containing protein [Fennellomyces sp. T-0311]|nr:heterokaryon incompatibility protein-domain-containing protein [Fennellomyces sp. T-0311]
MYIEYITPQRVADRTVTTFKSTGGPYRPTWLIRTSDWQKVPGTEATNGYCTLSYCWEQSGEKIQRSNGEYDLLDRGRHKITIEAREKRKTRRSVRYKYTRRSTHVTYEVLLKRICKEFNIDYLWYDKVCINQASKEEKHREIKNMHQIYSDARYTIALVPEIYVDDVQEFKTVDWNTLNTEAKETALAQIQESLWWKRSWTLEELMMSTRILIVGRDAHLWCLAESKQVKGFKENDFISNDMLGFKDKKEKSTNQVLTYAHFRTSTKEHDKIYALANIFDGMTSIEIDYDSDISVVMNAFYRQLAERDLSLMCFGSILDDEGTPKDTSTMGSYNLPSWTGVAGLHTQYFINTVAIDQRNGYTIDDNMHLHIKCRHYTLSSVTKYQDYGVFEDDERGKQADINYHKIITSLDDFDSDSKSALDWSIWAMSDATSCVPTHYWKPDHSTFDHPYIPLSLTEDCSECVIPAVLFDSTRSVTIDDDDPPTEVFKDHDYLLPVLKKLENAYKVIGIMEARHFQFDETRSDPQEFLEKLFNDLGSISEELIIA